MPHGLLVEYQTFESNNVMTENQILPPFLGFAEFVNFFTGLELLITMDHLCTEDQPKAQT